MTASKSEEIKQMPKELERYNHLRYNERTSEEKGFTDFLFENTETSAPEIDVDIAWNSFQTKIEKESKTKSNSWMRVAASITVLIGVSFFIWKVSTKVDQVMISTLDERMNITFPDGSTGVLNANSSFSFPEKFGDERLVSFEGEAFFDIKKSDKSFIIDVNGVEVRVLGTAFNLVSSTNEVELFVERGLVAFNKEGKQTRVAAGLKAIFNKANGEVIITENPSSNTTSWVDGKLDFNSASFADVISDIEEHYDVTFEVSNANINKCTFTGSFEKRSLSEVIETIEEILDIQMSKVDDVIKVSGTGC